MVTLVCSRRARGGGQGGGGGGGGVGGGGGRGVVDKGNAPRLYIHPVNYPPNRRRCTSADGAEMCGHFN